MISFDHMMIHDVLLFMLKCCRFVSNNYLMIIVVYNLIVTELLKFIPYFYLSSQII